MNNPLKKKCLAGISIKTGVLEVIASIDHFLAEHIESIELAGCYAVVADKARAMDAWGTVVKPEALR